MKNTSSSPLIALVMAVSIATLTGCGDDSDTKAPSPKEVQFLSHIDQAKFYQNQGQLKAAISESTSAIQLYPNRLKPYTVIFETLLLAGNPGEVESRIKELLAKEGVNLQGSEQQLHYLLAKSLYIQQKLDQAQTQLDYITANFKTINDNERLLQGDVYLATGKTEDAKKLYSDVSVADPTNVEALLGLSKVAFIEKNPEKAREIVSKITNSEQSTTEAWLWNARLYHIEQNYELAEESYVRALEDLSQVDTMTPQKYSTISSLIFVLRQQSKVAEASRYQEILDQSIPGEIKLRFETALDFFQKGNYDAAETELKAILDISSSHNPSGTLLGVVKNAQGDVVEAERILSLYVNDGSRPEVIKLLASLQLKLNKPSAAVETLQLGLAKNDTDASLISLLGISQVASGHNDEGIKNIEDAIKQSPDDDSLKVKYAQVLARTGKKEEALKYIQDSFTKKPDSSKLLTIYSYFLSEDKQTDKAIKIAKDWIQKNQKSADGYLVLGSLYLSDKQFSPAIEQFTQANKLDAANPLTLLNLGKAYSGNKQPQEAHSAFYEAIMLAPDSPDTNRMLYSYLNATQPIDEMVRSYEQLVEKLPEAIIPHIALAELYLKQKEIDKTLAVVSLPRFSKNMIAQNLLKAAAQEKAKQLVSDGKAKEAKAFIDDLIAKQGNDDIDLNLLLANIYYLSNEESLGLTIINDLKKSHKDSALPYEFLANQYFQKQDYEAAIDEYSQAWKIKPSELLAIRMSQTLKRLESNEALKPLQDWLEIDKNSPRVMTMLAMSYQEAGEKDKAIKAYEKLLAVHTTNAVAMNNLAWLYHEQKNTKAEALAKKASEIASSNPAILDTYGWILFENGKAEQASTILEKAYELDQSSAEIKEHLLAAYKALGKTFNSADFQ
ncbi:tetratricopeptide repeat protein [Alkalimarinus alittae]|uniref:Tetratricopeptide repeat protein n=1 Tax=Alkalimarinus alittae TaxID=2961619 RepID=A0ABY6MX55_9ALTE|nr:tetratricopeptide repeat protein [Alkalimarinus alittae]UZE94372.1 tetratricopeptide repeat protein [Alkalimarinus alittae]